MAPTSTQPPPPPPPPQPEYPNLEQFIEGASADSIATLLNPIREALDGLKGPRAEHGKKAMKAVERTEALLAHLLQVREQIEVQRKGSK